MNDIYLVPKFSDYKNLNDQEKYNENQRIKNVIRKCVNKNILDIDGLREGGIDVVNCEKYLEKVKPLTDEQQNDILNINIFFDKCLDIRQQSIDEDAKDPSKKDKNKEMMNNQYYPPNICRKLF